MERRKRILGILAIVIITTSILAQTILIKPVTAADPASWYMNVSGVLNSDSYALYPYKTDKSLNIGFSKFGEMIDSVNNIGLEYRDRDAFAPPAGVTTPPEITKNKWESGWIINITYHGTSGPRNVWAMAQHADLIDYGKDWIRVSSTYNFSGALTESDEDPRDVGKFIGTSAGPVNGGRKTNGTCVTDDIRVLYNDPRMFVARTVTHVRDWDPSWSEDEPLVDVIFTFIFNKDNKEVIVIKDIKEATTKFVFGEMTVPVDAQTNGTVNGAIIQFSNRGEWDIGPVNTYDSYVHFYVANNSEGFSTVYNDHYHLNPTLYPASWLGISTYGPQPTSTGTFDVAQIVSSDRTYAGWAAFWPSLSNWHVDAGYQDKWWKCLKQNEDAADSSIEPFMSPYLIGEWDFVLSKTALNVSGRHFDRQFRGVTVYGLTDNWNGDDAKRTGGSNVIDSEVTYQLQQIFNPWDLYQAVEMDTNRWVDFHTVTTAEKSAADSGTDLTFSLQHSPVKYAQQWDSYCNFTEQVEWGSGMKHPGRSVWVYPATTLSASEPYELSVSSSTGVGTITIRAASVPVVGTVIKTLYSTETAYNYTGTFGFLWTSYLLNETSSQVMATRSTSAQWTDKLGVTYNLTVAHDDFGFKNFTGQTMTPNNTFTYGPYVANWTTEPFIVFKGETTDLNWASSNFAKVNTTVQSMNGTLEMNQTTLDLHMYVTGPTHTDVHVWAFPQIYYTYNATWFTNTTSSFYNVTNYIRFGGSDGLYRETIPGRYEWVVVGNHSQCIDSIGAALVSAAFKNKQVEIGNGGLDMKNIWGTNVPYLMSNGTYTTWRPSGPAWTNIYDSIGRLHLVDDWCTRYPVSSSSIITVAGPSANLMSEYFNTFSQAIQIYGGIPDILLSDVIFATTCWNTTTHSGYLGQYYYKNGQFTYNASSNTGVAVITTYKDLNGTVGFMIHGWSGDDTYYATKWFHEYGIYYLQTENRGVTTLILRIDYNNATARTENPMPPNNVYDSHNPSVTILERLGTISEKTPHDP